MPHSRLVGTRGGLAVLSLLSLAIVLPGEASWAEVLAGPIANPGNGHHYYLLASTTWKASEAEAERLGGHLVTINDEAEHQWVWSTFSNWDGEARSLWIGLTDESTEATFVWISGEPVTYTRWPSGEPNNLFDEDFGMIFAPTDPRAGYWNDMASDNACSPACHGVVEVGNGQPRSTPVIFVHGWCGKGEGWDSMIASMQEAASDRYGAPGQKTDLYYMHRSNGEGVIQHRGVASSQVYVLNLTADGCRTGDCYDLNPVDVAHTRIVEKAYQLKQAIDWVKKETDAPKVAIVSHSQGGLVARAYVQGYACPDRNLDETTGVECPKGERQAYQSDVERVVTIDTPHLGSSEDDWGLLGRLQYPWLDLVLHGSTCRTADTVSRREMLPDSRLLQGLNRTGIPADVALTSIASFPPVKQRGTFSTIDGRYPKSVELGARSDGIVIYSSQSLKSEDNWFMNARNVSAEDNPVADCPVSVQGTFGIVHGLEIQCETTSRIVDRHLRDPKPRVWVDRLTLEVSGRKRTLSFDVVLSRPPDEIGGIVAWDAEVAIEVGSNRFVEYVHFKAEDGKSRVTIPPRKLHPTEEARVHLLFPRNLSLIDSEEAIPGGETVPSYRFLGP